MKKITKNTLKNTIEKEAEKFIRESSIKIPKILEGATLSLLGLEKSYSGGYEMDHCNGRNSVLVDAFRKIAQEEAQKIAKNYKPTKEDIAGFMFAFEREYKSQMSYQIREIARKKAIEDVTEEVNKIKIDVSKAIDEMLK